MTDREKLKRPNNGGGGRGQGRKPLHGVRKIQLSAQLTHEVVAYLDAVAQSPDETVRASRSESLDATVRATRAFRAWSAARKRAAVK